MMMLADAIRLSRCNDGYPALRFSFTDECPWISTMKDWGWGGSKEKLRLHIEPGLMGGNLLETDCSSKGIRNRGRVLLIK